MPELPEVETVRMQLEKYLVGQVIGSIEILHKKSVFGDTAVVVDKKIVAVRRLGKMLVIDVSGRYCIAIHFKMSGQLIFNSPKKHLKVAGGHPTSDWIRQLPSKHTRAIVRFAGGDVMYFNDQRMFGWVKIMTDKELTALPFVQRLGPEPWDITPDQLFARTTSTKKPIKVLLMEQDVLSGVGNIYANDGLWEAHVHPGRIASSLTHDEVVAISRGLIVVLRQGIKLGGATANDAKYVNLEGLGGKYQDHFRTYSREGLACLRGDGGVIEKITLGGRGTYFCPMCQK